MRKQFLYRMTVLRVGRINSLTRCERVKNHESDTFDSLN